MIRKEKYPTMNKYIAKELLLTRIPNLENYCRQDLIILCQTAREIILENQKTIKEQNYIIDEYKETTGRALKLLENR